MPADDCRELLPNLRRVGFSGDRALTSVAVDPALPPGVNKPCPPFLSRQRCKICREPLTVHQEVRGGICDRPQCRHEALRRSLAIHQAQAEAELRANTARHRNQVAASLRLARPDKLPIALVPASMRSATLLSAWRRRLFREHLATLMTCVEGISIPSRAPLPPEARPNSSQFDPGPPVLGAGCAACRGHCCRDGGSKAYIDAQTLQRFAEANSCLDRKGIVRAYISRLPKRSMENSCVFHGEQGCTLPRDMRSAICNNYRCDDLRKLQGIAARRVLITATYESEVVRSLVFSMGRIVATFTADAAASRVVSSGVNSSQNQQFENHVANGGELGSDADYGLKEKGK